MIMLYLPFFLKPVEIALNGSNSNLPYNESVFWVTFLTVFRMRGGVGGRGSKKVLFTCFSPVPLRT